MSENERLPPPVNLKHRLVGAIMLAAAAVIVLPLILREQEPPAELKSPAEESVSDHASAPTTGVLPIPAPNRAPAAKPAAPAAEDSAVGTVPAPAPAEAAPAAATEPAKGWVVQVGVFANEANAARLADTLKGQGHEVMLDHITLQNAKRLRLRVGPFADKAQAQQAQAEIRQATGVAGAVLGYP